MRPFDTVVVVDWSAGKRKGPKPQKDAIWLGITQDGASLEPVYCRSRQIAEQEIIRLIAAEKKAGRRLLCTFDFPFGYPAGFGRHVTGSDDPFEVWKWFDDRIEDAVDGSNNRFDLAEILNEMFQGAGPFWGKLHKDRWPEIPYRKAGIVFDSFAEKRACDLVSKASSSCFQLAFPPTVGGQAMMGFPMLNRLRRLGEVAVWPFEACEEAPVVLAEIWPGVIEKAVKSALAVEGSDRIRDRTQVRLLADALARLPVDRLSAHMKDIPPAAREEGWILGAGLTEELISLAARTPPLRNDCFALPQGVHWTPVAEALALLEGRLVAVAQVENVPITQACGRIAAHDVSAARANPALPNTAVDGYGFAGGRPDGMHRLPLVQGRAAAGDAPADVPPGFAIRVLTGAVLPQGVDTVILQEDVSVSDRHIMFQGMLKRGSNTRSAGEDVAAGDVIVSAGRRITAADLALLAATGLSQIAVRKRLRVGVLSTGDELVEAGASAAAGQIYDANRPMLLALLEQMGHEAVDLGQAPDDRVVMRRMLDNCVERVDAIITSGGASAGDEDHVSGLLEEAGAMTLWRIAIKPGRPLALGMWRNIPVFGLPGNPVAAMVCTLIFARPALGRLAGAAWQVPQGFEVPAAFSKRKKAGRREYLRARIRDGRAEVFVSEGSGRISGLSWAEGLVELDEDAREVAEGDPVRFIPFGSFGI
ncbi:molybdenum cofactor synthesis domain-containing protein [Sulfitobacter guttiformis]|uniref:Molybdopterin molybdenumtransferase n=1 Tax=Sulfitobacter guttiformis TaxID=74349 RepID=A0A420DQF2_9RHOB|nr:gephyrin-like molybdotransferase Glp [Sulfitobacter guttiformis]KIN73756.1 Molybdopterin binding domain [Sulfitobacter guttiformis KCTC 32187]RKE96389.1 molybdopterin molybdotransferase [Sulfitobacter guttiformis]